MAFFCSGIQSGAHIPFSCHVSSCPLIWPFMTLMFVKTDFVECQQLCGMPLRLDVPGVSYDYTEVVHWREGYPGADLSSGIISGTRDDEGASLLVVCLSVMCLRWCCWICPWCSYSFSFYNKKPLRGESSKLCRRLVSHIFAPHFSTHWWIFPVAVISVLF